MSIIQWKYNKRGISVIEILVVIAIIGVALVSILSLTTLSLKASILIKETTQASILAQEMIEAIRNFRDGIDWNNDDVENKYDGLGVINTGVAYHPEKSIDVPPKWMLIQGEEIVNGFSREVVFENVSRDPTTDDIEDIYNPTNDDSDTKKVIVTVSWKDKEVQIITYFTNWKE